MYVALLGRQPELSIAELERRFGDVAWFSAVSAMVDTQEPVDVQSLGGSQKIGHVILNFPAKDWQTASQRLVQHFQKHWSGHEGKLTLGISAYGFTASGRDVQKTALILKGKLKSAGVSVRLIPNQDAALSTATAHHNKLGLTDNKVELLVFLGAGRVVIAESIGTQNITALAHRDQGRPRRDAFVGMLPPKLALMMINLAGPLPDTKGRPVLLDPFCGTGVVLQEALLRNYDAYGTDLAPKMVSYSKDNLEWLQESLRVPGKWLVQEGDATDTRWQTPIDVVVAETYLGQPFSAPPSPSKLTEVRGNCQNIIGRFLKNLHEQIPDGTPVVLAVPAWRSTSGEFTHLPLTDTIEKFGFERVGFNTVRDQQLLYFRPDQIVARELLVLIKVSA